MDPNETLKRLRELIANVDRACEAAGDNWDETGRKTLVDVGNNAVELTELIGALDEWLSKGGFLPSVWAANREG